MTTYFDDDVDRVAAIIEKVSGSTYDHYVQDAILADRPIRTIRR